MRMELSCWARRTTARVHSKVLFVSLTYILLLRQLRTIVITLKNIAEKPTRIGQHSQPCYLWFPQIQTLLSLLWVQCQLRKYSKAARNLLWAGLHSLFQITACWCWTKHLRITLWPLQNLVPRLFLRQLIQSWKVPLCFWPRLLLHHLGSTWHLQPESQLHLNLPDRSQGTEMQMFLSKVWIYLLSWSQTAKTQLLPLRGPPQTPTFLTQTRSLQCLQSCPSQKRPGCRMSVPPRSFQSL